MKFITLFLIVMTIFSINLVSASTYYLEFSQVEDNLVVKESINGINLTEVGEYELEKTGIGYIFLKKIVFPGDFDNAIIRLNLDSGFVIGEEGAYPSSYKVETDGKKISLVWGLENVKANEPAAVFVNIRDLSRGYNWIWFILGLVVIILAGSLFLFYNLKKRKNIDKHLLDIERKVLNELKKAARHELWQKNIQANLGLSKAKTSRVIRNLESRKLIEKVPFGNTNKIVLK